MELNVNATVVMEKRILKKGADGLPAETIDGCFERVAEFISLADLTYGASEEEQVRTYEKFLRMLTTLEFLPNSPTLVNAGNDLGQLSACFVLPVEDSMDGIFTAVKNAAMIHKTGGGTGFSFNRLRGAGNQVSSTVGIASGPVSFMGVFDKATETIKQGGTRRGANMGILNVDHVDVLEFIQSKRDGLSLQNFNISVGMTNAFMENKNEEIWQSIIENAWHTGDPGLVFLDRANDSKSNPVPKLGPIEATNPCGEQFLYPYDSCNLGSIDVSKFVKNETFDYARLNDTVADAIHFLDNVIDMNLYPLPEIEEMSRNIRRVGLGIMGWADALIQMKVKYDSQKALDVASELMSFIQQAADRASLALGMKRGAFPLWEDSIYVEKGEKYRNATRTTIAPTGTISIIAGCSSGIEPLFGLAFKRSHYVADDPNTRKEMIEVNRFYYDFLKDRANGGDFVEEINLALTGQKVPDAPDYFVVSHEINPNWHLAHQAAFQLHTDNAVSKTINLPNSATVEDVASIYENAYALQLKGITIYRDGSKNQQVLSFEKDETESDSKPVHEGIRKRLPNPRRSITKHFKVGEQSGYIIAGLYENGNPGEVFIVANRAGTAVRGYLDTIGILTSFALQHGVGVEGIAEKLSGVRFDPSGLTGDPDIPVATSVVDFVFRWLRRTFVDKAVIQEYNEVPSGNMCPECSGALFFGEGCETCMECGYSRCG